MIENTGENRMNATDILQEVVTLHRQVEVYREKRSSIESDVRDGRIGYRALPALEQEYQPLFERQVQRLWGETLVGMGEWQYQLDPRGVVWQVFAAAEKQLRTAVDEAAFTGIDPAFWPVAETRAADFVRQYSHSPISEKQPFLAGYEQLDSMTRRVLQMKHETLLNGLDGGIWQNIKSRLHQDNVAATNTPAVQRAEKNLSDAVSYADQALSYSRQAATDFHGKSQYLSEFSHGVIREYVGTNALKIERGGWGIRTLSSDGKTTVYELPNLWR